MSRQRPFFPMPEGVTGHAGGTAAGDVPASPLYLQIKLMMRDKIDARTWRAGEAIPSEAELCAQFQVSRGTIRHALRELALEGYIITKKGSGSFVAQGGLPRPAAHVPLSFATLLHERGIQFTTRVVTREVVGAPRSIAAHLGVLVGAPALFMRRVRSVGGDAIVCQESWSNLEVCPRLDEADFERESLFDAVQRCSGKRVAASNVRYLSFEAGPGHAALLSCAPSDALLGLEQVISLDDGSVVEWSLTSLRPGTSIVASALPDDVTRGHLETDAIVRGGDRLQGGPGKEAALRRRLELQALQVRRDVVSLAHRYEGVPFHLGGALSMVEIVVALLLRVMRTGKDSTPWEERDRLVLSKAHASVALYPALLRAGLISQDDLDRGLFGEGAVLFKHPQRDPSRGIETSGGSLGMGLGYAAGLALALRRTHPGARTFCIVGDGECEEGSVWESAAFAGFKRLENLTVIVDANGMQLDGPTSEIMDNGPIQRKFAAFGFETQEVDGHDVMALVRALSLRTDRPRAIVARTIKGKGVSFAENNVIWHDNALSRDDYERAMGELDAREEAVRHGRG
ncbi:UTRA domain-containing protein [Olsenella massiliensis]|uniref:UTRA domain-containing protein n=1 Tax=Olsenella massiliensis TaxID=1622075 RepID=UPI00071C35ED|nr:UTRA domain-containing protein [Olsenella massiliensis]